MNQQRIDVNTRLALNDILTVCSQRPIRPNAVLSISWPRRKANIWVFVSESGYGILYSFNSENDMWILKGTEMAPIPSVLINGHPIDLLGFGLVQGKEHSIRSIYCFFFGYSERIQMPCHLLPTSMGSSEKHESKENILWWPWGVSAVGDFGFWSILEWCD
jgi:hypothetical protein